MAMKPAQPLTTEAALLRGRETPTGNLVSGGHFFSPAGFS